MIVQLADEILTADLPSVAGGLEAVLRAHHYGFHYLIASRSQCTQLRERFGDALSHDARAALHSIYQEYSYGAEIADKLPYRMLVTREGDEIELEMGTFKVPIAVFLDYPLTETSLVGEDLNDVKAMTAAAKFWAANTFGPSRVGQRYRPIHGAGSRIADVFSDIVGRKAEPAFCVTDTDRIRPGGSCKHYARRCSELAANSKALCAHYLIPAREIENIVPLELIEAIPDLPKDRIEEWRRFRTLAPSGYLHADLKDGLRYRWLRKHSSQREFREYWLSVLRAIDAHGDIDTDCCADENCNCSVISGLGSRLLERLCDAFESGMVGHEVELSCPDVVEGWFSLGRQVLSWTICARPQRL